MNDGCMDNWMDGSRWDSKGMRRGKVLDLENKIRETNRERKRGRGGGESVGFYQV